MCVCIYFYIFLANLLTYFLTFLLTQGWPWLAEFGPKTQQLANLSDQSGWSDFLVGSNATRDHFRQHVLSECGDPGLAVKGR